MQTENLLKRVNVQELYPPFLDKVVALTEALWALGLEFWVVSGLRSFAEQEVIYNQGRTTPCSQCRAKGIVSVCGHIISKAQPGFSPHQYGVAVDLCHDLDPGRLGLQPDWTVKNYEPLYQEALKLDLESGLHWKFQDAPHVQLPLGRYGIKWPALVDLYRGGGMVAVWHFLDQFQW